MSDERDVADDAATDGDDTQDDGGRTAVVTKTVARPQRPTGKRSRQRPVDVDDSDGDADETVEVDVAAKKAKKDQAKDTSKSAKAKAAQKTKKAKKPSKPGTRPANPIAFVYNYLKQVVAEMRKVIWPSRKQMLTYTSVVLVFLAFMTALVGGVDLGLSKLVLYVFGGS